MALTLILCFAHSFASALVKPATADFDAVYAGTVMPPWNESNDAMFTILPEPCSIILRPAAWESRNTLVRFTSITVCQSSSVNSTAGARRIIPALLIRMSMRPSFSKVSSTTFAGESGSAMSPTTSTPFPPDASIARSVSAEFPAVLQCDATAAPASARASAID